MPPYFLGVIMSKAEEVLTVKEEQVIKDKKRKNLTYQRDKDREKVKGIFHFYEVPGGVMGFSYKKYKGDAVEKYRLHDGQVYTLPLGVAKHLNSNGSYPVHQYQMDETGKPLMVIGKKKRRFGFQSLEFVDVEELQQAREEELIVTAHSLR